MIVFDTKTEIVEAEKIDELSGKLAPTGEEDKLMRTVLENDKQKIEDGKLITEAINQGMGAFTPDLMFEQLVKNFKMAKQLYGETILRALTGYDPDYIEKNKHVPEFGRELKEKIRKRIEQLKEEKLIDKDGSINEDGYRLSALILYTEELDKLKIRGIGERVIKEWSLNGEKKEVKPYRKDRYKDLALKASVKKAARRKHKDMIKEDLVAYTREKTGHIQVIYALDASGSMRGEKIKMAKKAGIALAFKALDEKDKVGLIVFGSEIRTEIPPTTDFGILLSELTRIRASKETNLAATIRKAAELFTHESTKHLVLLTDAIPTVGKEPEEETLKAASEAINQDITISIIGIKLDEKGEKLAQQITEIGNGRLYVTTNPETLDTVILEDYYTIKAETNPHR